MTPGVVVGTGTAAGVGTGGATGRAKSRAASKNASMEDRPKIVSKRPSGRMICSSMAEFVSSSTVARVLAGAVMGAPRCETTASSTSSIMPTPCATVAMAQDGTGPWVPKSEAGPAELSSDQRC